MAAIDSCVEERFSWAEVSDWLSAVTALESAVSLEQAVPTEALAAPDPPDPAPVEPVAPEVLEPVDPVEPLDGALVEELVVDDESVACSVKASSSMPVPDPPVTAAVTAAVLGLAVVVGVLVVVVVLGTVVVAVELGTRRGALARVVIDDDEVPVDPDPADEVPDVPDEGAEGVVTRAVVAGVVVVVVVVVSQAASAAARSDCAVSRLSWASVTCCWAVARVSSSSCLASAFSLPFSAWLNASCALSRLAWAICKLRLSVVGSRVPRIWPAVTFCPTDTLTLLMVPPVSKPTSSTWAGATLPLAVTTDSTVPRVTVVVRLDVVEPADARWKTDSTPKKTSSAAATRRTPLTTRVRLLHLRKITDQLEPMSLRQT